jgi:hypothetical protein
MRRIVLASLAVSFLLASVLPAQGLETISISSSGLSKKTVHVKLGGAVTWSDQLDHDVSVVSKPLPYWSCDVATGAEASTTMTLAGIWQYTLADDPTVIGIVRVPPQVSATTVPVGVKFTLTASTDITRSGYEYDVLRKRVGVGTFQTVAGGIGTASVQVKMPVAGDYLWAIRTFGFNPEVGYDTYTPLSPRIAVTATA